MRGISYGGPGGDVEIKGILSLHPGVPYSIIYRETSFLENYTANFEGHRR
jgi:hypothetical protein